MEYPENVGVAVTKEFGGHTPRDKDSDTLLLFRLDFDSLFKDTFEVLPSGMRSIKWDDKGPRIRYGS